MALFSRRLRGTVATMGSGWAIAFMVTAEATVCKRCSHQFTPPEGAPA